MLLVDKLSSEIMNKLCKLVKKLFDFFLFFCVCVALASILQKFQEDLESNKDEVKISVTNQHGHICIFYLITEVDQVLLNVSC